MNDFYVLYNPVFQHSVIESSPKSNFFWAKPGKLLIFIKELCRNYRKWILLNPPGNYSVRYYGLTPLPSLAREGGQRGESGEQSLKLNPRLNAGIIENQQLSQMQPKSYYFL